MPEQPTGRTYLDYAATAPLDGRLHAAMMEASWANASSLHAEGRAARKQHEDARKRIASALGARQPAEIVFTSGGTESDNTALAGLIAANAKPERTCVIVSNIEHHAVLDAAAVLKARGFKVAQVKCDASGIVTPEALEAAIDAAQADGLKVALASVMAVNNELGTIQPVRELAATAHAHGALFFTDAVQALGKLDIQLEQSGVDAASFSAHKIGALKGVGALYLRRGTRCTPFMRGGGQEAGMRSGTSNVLGALTFAAAVENATAERVEVWERCIALREQLLEGLGSFDAAHAIVPTLGSQDRCVPHIVSLLANGLEGETLVQRLDMAGIACSSASACSSGNLDPSHVMMALGLPKQKAYGSLRISFGQASMAKDVEHLLAALPHALR